MQNHFKTVDNNSPYFAIVKWMQHNFYIIGLYNPAISQSNRKGNEKALTIYPELSMTISPFIHNSKLLIMGDMNAHFGEITGDNFRFDSANEIMLNSFIEKHKLSIMNVHYAYGICTRIGKNSESICDYALINDKFKNCKVQFDVHYGKYIDSDHFPIIFETELNTNTNDQNHFSIIENDYFLLLQDNDKDKLKQAINFAKQLRQQILKSNNFSDDTFNRHCQTIGIDRTYGLFEYCWNAAMIKYGIFKQIKKTKHDWKNYSFEQNKDSNQLNKIRNELQASFDKLIDDKNNVELKHEFEMLKEKYKVEFIKYQRRKINNWLNSIDEFELKNKGNKIISHIRKLNNNNDDGALLLNGNIATSINDKCNAFYDYYCQK